MGFVVKYIFWTFLKDTHLSIKVILAIIAYYSRNQIQYCGKNNCLQSLEIGLFQERH